MKPAAISMIRTVRRDGVARINFALDDAIEQG